MTASSAIKPEERRAFLAAVRDLLPTLRRLSDEMLEKRIGKDFDTSCLEALGFVSSGTEQALTQGELTAMLCQVLRSLEKYMSKELKIPVTLNSLLSHLSCLPHAVNADFPGYADVRMLKYLIQPGP